MSIYLVEMRPAENDIRGYAAVFFMVLNRFKGTLHGTARPESLLRA